MIVQCEPPKDVETYIHRSGRTARAGKNGTVITFYVKKYMALLNRIENVAGIKFTKIGAPQPDDIIKASSKFILEGLKKVECDVLPLFEETAELLTKEFGEKKALLLTLAYISGNLNKIKKRSLLSGTEGFVTYQLETNNVFYALSYIWGILKRFLSTEDTNQIRQMRCYKNYKGAAFDVPEKLIPTFEQAYEREKSQTESISYIIKRSQELPDLKEFDQISSTFDRRDNFRDHTNYGHYKGSDRRNSPYYKRNRSRSRSRHRYRSRSKSRNRNRSRSRSRSESSSRSDSRSPIRGSYRTRTERIPIRNRNEIFMWGLETEDDVKNFLSDYHIGWKRVKVLLDDKGGSKLVSFVTVDEDKVSETLKLNGIKIKGRQLRISLASDKPKR